MSVHNLSHSISLHAWNNNFSQLAMVPTGSNEVYIYSVGFPSKTTLDLKLLTKLSVHSQTITALDWSPIANRIVTTSEDCSERMWDYDSKEQTWKETVVVTSATRAGLAAKWSPSGDRFAVGTGQKSVSLCYLDTANGFWTDANSVIKKPHKSAVTALSWSPNATFLATCCTDFHVRVFSNPPPTSSQQVLELPFSSWAIAVAFSPNSMELVVSLHSSTIVFVNLETREQQVLPLQGLPESCLLYKDEETLIAGGHDCNPHVYKKEGGVWKFEKNLDTEVKGKPKSSLSSLAASFERIKVETTDFALKTIHQNAITSMSAIHNNEQLVTTSSDGKLVVWNL
ncbi:hypothetical protein RCL1_000158 [Eukaryota sp. TZLM3-RCL]